MLELLEDLFVKNLAELIVLGPLGGLFFFLFPVLTLDNVDPDGDGDGDGGGGGGSDCCGMGNIGGEVTLSAFFGLLEP